MNNEEISFLLGAGFSANKGYPIGSILNNLIVGLNGNEFSFHTSGKLVVSTDGKKPNMGFPSSDDICFDFLQEVISIFQKSKGYFDYEEFYDFISDEGKSNSDVIEIAKKYDFYWFSDHKQMLFNSKKLLNQIILFLLKDNEGKKYYDDEPFKIGGGFPGYHGFLRCLSALSKNNLVHVHTLNHDLYFESFSNSDFIESISDGFSEHGSPYYGDLHSKGRIYRVRLAYFNESYSGNIRLYKLHGSINYVPFHFGEGGSVNIENYIKTRYGVGTSELYKEINKDGKLEYFQDWVNYHPDFLTGTSSKIFRYDEPVFYKKLFNYFNENLSKSNSLIIIGYGGRDQKVNELIINKHLEKRKNVVIVDPNPGPALQELGKKLEAKFVNINLEKLDLNDLAIFDN